MELEEGGEKFVEKIKVDTEANTEEYSVPKHANRVAIDTLKDFTKVYLFFNPNKLILYLESKPLAAKLSS